MHRIMDTIFLIEYEYINYCRRNIEMDGNSNLTLLALTVLFIKNQNDAKLQENIKDIHRKDAISHFIKAC